MNILEEIIIEKKRQVALDKERKPVDTVTGQKYFTRECYPLAAFVRDPSRTGIIAEFKKRSPSKGWINRDADVVRVTRGYASYGASALSVLTDTPFFGGTIEDLDKARLNELPVLRKDFIIDEYQVLESKAAGADVILLIAACLSKQEIRQLSRTAKNLGLDVLLELHAEEEVDMICDTIDVVGINNRNLKTFEVDIENSIRIADRIPEICKISESGIDSAGTIKRLQDAGFEGFLIGERFMKEVHPAIAFKQFIKDMA